MGYKEVTLDEVPEKLKNTQEYKSVIDRLNKKGSLKDFDLEKHHQYFV